MNHLGIEVSLRNPPSAEPGFLPLAAWNKAFLRTARQPFAVALRRNGGCVAVTDTFIHGTPDRFEADCLYVERLVKVLLWVKGGWEVSLCGDTAVAGAVRAHYVPGGRRNFDIDLMSRVYEQSFSVRCLPYDQRPVEVDQSAPVGRHLEGCRIGFDAGGSDRKVSALVDGEVVFSEEVVWFPKEQEDPEYHFEGIVEAFRAAADRMPRVDAIGVSSAGIYVGNRTRVASLFNKIPQELFDAKVVDIYPRAAAVIGLVPVEVANDGDVTALAGAMSLEDNCVLGIAMGTSEAGGYVDAEGNITGWLNELAFVPLNLSAEAPVDDWSGDVGCGVSYFSQDGVTRLAQQIGLPVAGTLSQAEKLKAVQSMAEAGNPAALRVFETIGVDLAHTLPLYAQYYDMKHLLLLGRVVSGVGGDTLCDATRRVLRDEYPELAARVALHLPDEKIRRVGQSVAAASLPALK